MAQRQRICLPIQEMLETWVRSLEAEMATHSSILTGKTAWPEETGGLQFMGSQSDPWRQKWQPIPVFLPGKLHGQRDLVGYSSWGHD